VQVDLGEGGAPLHLGVDLVAHLRLDLLRLLLGHPPAPEDAGVELAGAEGGPAGGGVGHDGPLDALQVGQPRLEVVGVLDQEAAHPLAQLPPHPGAGAQQVLVALDAVVPHPLHHLPVHHHAPVVGDGGQEGGKGAGGDQAEGGAVQGLGPLDGQGGAVDELGVGGPEALQAVDGVLGGELAPVGRRQVVPADARLQPEDIGGGVHHLGHLGHVGHDADLLVVAQQPGQAHGGALAHGAGMDGDGRVEDVGGAVVGHAQGAAGLGLGAVAGGAGGPRLAAGAALLPAAHGQGHGPRRPQGGGPAQEGPPAQSASLPVVGHLFPLLLGGPGRRGPGPGGLADWRYPLPLASLTSPQDPSRRERRRGSQASRRVSPRRLKPSTARLMAPPGKRASQGASRALGRARLSI